MWAPVSFTQKKSLRASTNLKTHWLKAAVEAQGSTRVHCFGYRAVLIGLKMGST